MTSDNDTRREGQGHETLPFGLSCPPDLSSCFRGVRAIAKRPGKALQSGKAFAERTSSARRETLQFFVQGSTKGIVQDSDEDEEQEDAGVHALETAPSPSLLQPQQKSAEAARTDAKSEKMEAWLRSALSQTTHGDDSSPLGLGGLRDVKQVSTDIILPSNQLALLIVDSQPAVRAAADNLYSRSDRLWDALPRGHTEVFISGKKVCEVVGLRKFGDAKEKFGPLAKEANGTRTAAKEALSLALNKLDVAQGWTGHFVFLTKENGEMAKVSFFRHEDKPYVVATSKNVSIVLNASSYEVALKDLKAYSEARYEFAQEIAEVFLRKFFTNLTSQQRDGLVAFVTEFGITLCGESINPERQHIQSYRDESGSIPAEIRFFAATKPGAFARQGLTFGDPVELLPKLRSFGLSVVEAVEEAALTDLNGLADLEGKHRTSENREGAVVYVVLRPPPGAVGLQPRTAFMYKWKNAWYVTVRAMREKFFDKCSEASITSRIRSLYLHHPDETDILNEYLGFYRWVMLLLPGVGCYWVSLKASFDLFSQEKGDHWQAVLPECLRSDAVGTWLSSFRKAHSTLQEVLPQGRWVEVLSKRRRELDEHLEDLPKQLDIIRSWGVPGPAAHNPRGLVVAVMLRGLQGSGKSTLARALRAYLGGEWVNQDEVAAAYQQQQQTKRPRRGTPSPKLLFLRALEEAVARGLTTASGGAKEQRGNVDQVGVLEEDTEKQDEEAVQFVFVDKINTLKQHRSEIREALKLGSSRPGMIDAIRIVLVDLVHPEDTNESGFSCIPTCTERITQRSLGHLTFLPQASSVANVITNAVKSLEAVDDEESCEYDAILSLNLTLPPEKLLEETLQGLKAKGFLPKSIATSLESEMGSRVKLEAAVEDAGKYEKELMNNWKTLSWVVKLSWDQILTGNLRLLDALSTALESCRSMDKLPNFSPMSEPHVTLLWVGDQAEAELKKSEAITHEALLLLESQAVDVKITSVVCDPQLGLIALTVEIATVEGKQPVPCCNEFPHITAAKKPEVKAVASNEVLRRLHSGSFGGLEQYVLLEPVVVGGVISRMVSKMGSPSTFNAPDVAEGMLENHLETSDKVVDILATFDASIRWGRVSRAFKALPCLVSEPLEDESGCGRGLPKLMGKQWFTFHERPLSLQSLQALRKLEKANLLSTLHVAAGYFHVPGLTTTEGEELKTALKKAFDGRQSQGLERAMEATLEIVQMEHHQPPAASTSSQALATTSFYLNCKHAGEQTALHRWRPILASTIALKMGWVPTLKAADVTIAVSVRKDWVLLSIPLPRATAPLLRAAADAGSENVCSNTKNNDVTINGSSTTDHQLGVEEKPSKESNGTTAPPAASASGAAVSSAAEASAAAAGCSSEAPEVATQASPKAAGKASGKGQELLSKSLSMILRHTAKKLNINMRSDGFCAVPELLQLDTIKKHKATVESIATIVEKNDKKRFELKVIDDVLHIRATQGHTIKGLDDSQLLRPLKLEDVDLPEFCVHGTQRRHLMSIAQQGLLAGERNHVHFVPFEPFDTKVISGLRYNAEVVLYIDLRQALADGLPFFLSSNKVLLSPGVAGVVGAKYIQRVFDLSTKAEIAFPPETKPTLDMALLEEGHLSLDFSTLGGGCSGGGEDLAEILYMLPALVTTRRQSIYIYNIRLSPGRGIGAGLRQLEVCHLLLLSSLLRIRCEGCCKGSTQVAFINLLPPAAALPASASLSAPESEVTSLACPAQLSDDGEALGEDKATKDRPGKKKKKNQGGDGALKEEETAKAAGPTVALSATMLILGLLPNLMHTSGETGSAVVRALSGATNSLLEAPSIDYLQVVVAPTLKRLFDVDLKLEVSRRGYGVKGSSGSVLISVFCHGWPLLSNSNCDQGNLALTVVPPGEAAKLHGLTWRSQTVPHGVVPRFAEGFIKKTPAGALVELREHLSGMGDLPFQWTRIGSIANVSAAPKKKKKKTAGSQPCQPIQAAEEEEEAVASEPCQAGPSEGGDIGSTEEAYRPDEVGDGCGILLVIETAAGTLYGGESIGRQNVMAEKVGQEAAHSLLKQYEEKRSLDIITESLVLSLVSARLLSARLRVSAEGLRDPTSLLSRRLKVMRMLGVHLETGSEGVLEARLLTSDE